MAEKRATLVLQLKDRASKAMGGVKNGLQKLRQSWLAVSVAVGGAIAIGASAVRAFFKQEDAVEKLNVALRNQGITSQAVSKDLQDYAAQLQKVTTFGDETIIEMQGLLATFGLMGDELKGATKAALDLSTGLGIDLKAATLLLGKAAAGDITTLSRYGIKIAEGTAESEKFAEVLKIVNERFGGAAQARLNTYSGQIENLFNRVGDLKERLGKELLPILETWAGWLERIVGHIEEISGLEEEALTGRELTIESLERQQQVLVDIFNEKGKLTEQDRRRMILITNALKREKALLADELKAKQKQSKELNKLEDSDKDKNLTRQKEIWEARKAFAQQTVGLANIMFSQMKTIFARDTKALFFIEKAAALASAIMNVALGVTRALALPAGIGIPLAAVIKALGAVQIGIIAATTIAGAQEGGIVPARPGGTVVRVGEGGSPEAIIPLEEGGPVGGVTINVGVLVGSEESVRELAKMVDKEMFDLRRNNESVAFTAI